MRVYIAGAITNNPNYKEQFKAAEERLRARGFEVINPALNQGYTYREYINIGLFELMTCDAIYLLKGYEGSTGATLEHDYARTVGLEVMYEKNDNETPESNVLSLLNIARSLKSSVTISPEGAEILHKALTRYIEKPEVAAVQEA